MYEELWEKIFPVQCNRILLLLSAIIGVMNLVLYEYFKTVLQKPFPSILFSFCPALATSTFHCFSSKPSRVYGNYSFLSYTTFQNNREKTFQAIVPDGIKKWVRNRPNFLSFADDLSNKKHISVFRHLVISRACRCKVSTRLTRWIFSVLVLEVLEYEESLRRLVRWSHKTEIPITVHCRYYNSLR